MKITSQNPAGLILLALRAGKMEAGQMAERFPGASGTATVGWAPRAQQTQNYHPQSFVGHGVPNLHKLGYIERTGPGCAGYFRLTAAGRAACPARRAIESPPAPLLQRGETA